MLSGPPKQENLESIVGRILNSGEGHHIVSIPESRENKFVVALSALGRFPAKIFYFPFLFQFFPVFKI